MDGVTLSEAVYTSSHDSAIEAALSPELWDAVLEQSELQEERPDKLAVCLSCSQQGAAEGPQALRNIVCWAARDQAAVASKAKAADSSVSEGCYTGGDRSHVWHARLRA
jgi:hypothetical protein